MNQTFDIHRFALVMKLDLVERGKNYLSIAMLLTILLLSMMLPIVTSSQPSGFFEALHYIAMFTVMLFASSFYTVNSMTHYAALPTSVNSLMLPASQLEKFLSALFFNFLFIIPFLALYFKLHYMTVDIANAKLPASGYQYPYIPLGLCIYLTFAYLLLHSVCFLGSIYFSKGSYVKTAAFIVGAVILVFMVHIGMARHFTYYPSKLNTLPLASWRIWYFEQSNFLSFRGMAYYDIKLTETANLMVQFFTAIFIISFWFTAYLRLKEKQV
jgi:hypothetical protein